MLLKWPDVISIQSTQLDLSIISIVIFYADTKFQFHQHNPESMRKLNFVSFNKCDHGTKSSISELLFDLNDSWHLRDLDPLLWMNISQVLRFWEIIKRIQTNNLQKVTFICPLPFLSWIIESQILQLILQDRYANIVTCRLSSSKISTCMEATSLLLHHSYRVSNLSIVQDYFHVVIQCLC